MTTNNTTIKSDDIWKFESPVNFNTIDVDGLTGSDGIILLNGVSLYGLVSSQPDWDGSHTIVAGNSANWDSTYTTVQANSADWDSTYTTVQSNSASWGTHTDISEMVAASANWDSTYTTVQANSSNWDSTYTTVQSNSAAWDSGDAAEYWVQSNFVNVTGDQMSGSLDMGNFNITNVDIISATEIHTLSAFTHYQDIMVSELSGFNVLGNIAVTGNVIVDGDVTANNLNVDNWDSTYTTVQSNSASWDSLSGWSLHPAITTVEIADQPIEAVQYIDFSTTTAIVSAIASQEGRMYWGDDDGTLNLGMPGGDVTLQIGQEQIIRVQNDGVANITNGQAVYITGAQGNRPKVAVASNESALLSNSVIGLATEDLDVSGGERIGYVTTFGMVRDIDTSHLPVGKTVFLGTSGALISAAPVSPNHGVVIGYCLNSHATNGIVYVELDLGGALNDLHDAKITLPQNDDVLLYNSVSSIWMNSNESTNWNSTYTTVSANSAVWDSGDAAEYWVQSNFVNVTGDQMYGSLDMGGFNITNINIISATEIHTVSAFTQYQDIIISELSGFNVLGSIAVTGNVIVDGDVTANNLNIGNWNSVYSNVQSNSADWQSTFGTVCALSANWNSAYTNVQSNSADWESTFTTVQSNSADWDSTYTTVQSNSADWGYSPYLPLSGGTMTGPISVGAGGKIYESAGAIIIQDVLGQNAVLINSSGNSIARQLANVNGNTVVEWGTIPKLKNVNGVPLSEGTAISGEQIVNYQTMNAYTSAVHTTVQANSAAWTAGPSTFANITADNIQINNTVVFASEYNNGNSGAVFTVNWNNGNKQKVTLTATTTATFTAPSGVSNLLLKVAQLSGSDLVTWPVTVLWPSGTAPTLTITASGIDIISFYYDGTNYFGVGSLDFQ